MHRRDTGDPDNCSERFQRKSNGDDGGGAETRDQRAGEEAWSVHRHDVPLNPEVGVAEAELAPPSA